MKKLLGLGLVLTLAVGMISGCGSSSSSSSSSDSSSGDAETVVIQMGHANPGKENDPYNKYCTLFGEHLSELSGGKDMYEGLQMGTIDAALVTTMVVANFVPEYQFLDLPYLFRSYDDVHTILDNEDIMADIEAKSYDN